MEINFEITNPVGEQIIKDIFNKVANGELKSGDKILSVREMAAKWSVCPDTVQRAYSQLKQIPLIETKRGLGTFISDNKALIKNFRTRFIYQKLDSFINEMKEIGTFSIDEIINYLKIKYDKYKELCIEDAEDAKNFLANFEKYAEFEEIGRYSITFRNEIDYLTEKVWTTLYKSNDKWYFYSYGENWMPLKSKEMTKIVPFILKYSKAIIEPVPKMAIKKEFNSEAARFFGNLSEEDRKGMVYQRLSMGDIEFIKMYRDDGKEKPVMFVIHGGPGKKEQVLDWVNKYSHEGFYTITLDVAAHGENNRGPMLNMDAWLETIGYIDTLIEYAKKSKQVDSKRFGIAGFSMGGTIAFLYGARGKYIPSVLLPEIGTPDFTEILNGRANGIYDHSNFIGEDTSEEIIKKAQELSPLNDIERFINIPMYARFGETDDKCGIGGVRLFIDKLKKAGGTIQELTILAGYGHGGFPDDYGTRMNYIKKYVGI
jgi:GntR family transcriptional regulator